MFVCGIIFLSFISTTFALNFAEVGEFPFEVSIVYRKQFTCGGALVATNYVVTAAHCLMYKQSNYVTVVVGAVDQELFTEQHTYEIIGYLLHPRYLRQTRDFDIALVKLQYDLLEDQVIKLVQPNFEIENQMIGTMVYWNREEGIKLTHTEVNVWHPQQCTAVNIWGEYDFNQEVPLTSERTICSGIPQDSCIGDDAGSLLIDGKLLGIATWNVRCDSQTQPVVLLNLAVYWTWINRVMEDNNSEFS